MPGCRGLISLRLFMLNSPISTSYDGGGIWLMTHLMFTLDDVFVFCFSSASVDNIGSFISAAYQPRLRWKNKWWMMKPFEHVGLGVHTYVVTASNPPQLIRFKVAECIFKQLNFIIVLIEWLKFIASCCGFNYSSVLVMQSHHFVSFIKCSQ